MLIDRSIIVKKMLSLWQNINQSVECVASSRVLTPLLHLLAVSHKPCAELRMTNFHDVIIEEEGQLKTLK